MADAATKEDVKKHASEARGSESERSTALQRSGERNVGRPGTPSLFSLSPRDFFTASPFELMRRFSEEMDQFFQGGGPGWSRQSSMTMWSPAIEIREQDGRFTVSAELPGMNKQDVKVELTPDGLTISGERKREQEEQRGGVYRSERSYGSFLRTIPIPDDANLDQAKATFDNGILTVTIPVPETRQRRREIPIDEGDISRMQAKAA